MTLNPWMEAKKWYTEQGLNFEDLLGSYFNEGFVWSSQTEFMLCKPCLLEDGFQYCGDVEPNCYHVTLAAGRNPMKRLMDLAPKKLPYVTWHRRNREDLHIYEWDKLNRRLNNGINNSTSPGKA